MDGTAVHHDYRRRIMTWHAVCSLRTMGTKEESEILKRGSIYFLHRPKVIIRPRREASRRTWASKRTLPAARVAGEDVYAMVSHGSHTHTPSNFRPSRTRPRVS